MKKIFFSLVMLLSTIVLSAQIEFEKGDFAYSLDKAKKEGKVLFIDMYAVWCGPCKKMDATVFMDREVGEFFSKNIVALKLDSERGEGPVIKKRYGVEGLPGYIFLDGDGGILHRSEGSMPKEKFMEQVRIAVEAAKDPLNISTMAAQYPIKKNDEDFLSLYIQRLNISGSKKHTDVLEQYLKIQKKIDPASEQMVNIIFQNIDALIFGGYADEIIKRYLWSNEWEPYVRKKIREKFQGIAKIMAQRTSDYANEKRDTTYLRIAVNRAKECGLQFDDNQLDRLLQDYYFNTSMGDEFKKSIFNQINDFANSLDIEDLKAKHKIVQQQIKENPNQKRRSYATINSEKLRYIASRYAKFTEPGTEDAKNILKWAKLCYDIESDNFENVNFYASAQYMFGDKSLGMELKTKAVQMSLGEKRNEAIADELSVMKNDKRLVF